MAKDNNLKDGLDALFGSAPRASGTETTEKPQPSTTGRRGRPHKDDSNSFYAKTKVKTSLQLETDQYEKVKTIARENGMNINEVVHAALKGYISRYEEKYGPIHVGDAPKRDMDI